MKKTVLIINRGMGAFIGGGENFDLRTAQALTEIGCRVKIITCAGPNQRRLINAYPFIDFSFIRVPYFRRVDLWRGLPVLLKKAANFLLLESDLFLFECAAIWHLTRSKQKHAIIMAGGLIRLGAVLSFSNKCVINRLPGPVSRTVWALNLNLFYVLGTAQIVANGDAFVRSRWLGRLQYLDIGYPAAAGLDSVVPLSERSVDYAWIGRLEHIKGADRLPRLIREILTRQPQATFGIAGGGSLLPKICGELSGNSTVTIFGEISSDGVADLLRKSKRLVMLSRYDNWPNVIFEALSVGCAVFAPDVGGIRKIGEQLDGVTVFPPEGDEAVLAGLILGVALPRPEDLVQAYSQNSRSWKQVAEDILGREP